MSETLGVDWARTWIDATTQSVAERRDELGELDRLIGDGDHGENLSRGFAAASGRLAEAEPPETICDVLKVVGGALMSTVGGAAGPLYGTAFMRAAKACTTAEIDARGVVALLEAALEGVTTRGRATAGEKTMVDAWTPALAAARDAADRGSSPAEVLEAAAEAARSGAADTIPLQATKGRASYLGERSVGHRDPGAESTALIIDAAARAAG